MQKHTTPQEVLFFAVSNKRTLSEILGKRTRGLIKHQNVICENLLMFRPVNPYEEKIFETKYKLYQEIQAELKNSDFGEFVSNVKLPIIKKSKPVYVPKKAPQKYKHKQIEVKPRKEITLDELLEENTRLVQRLTTFDAESLKEAVVDLEKYKHVQSTLAKRGIKYSSYYHFNYNTNNRSKIFLLLGGKCEDCGTSQNLTIHHVTPKKDGGSNNITNLKVLCRCCHDKVHGIAPRNGFIMRMMNEAGIRIEA